MYYTEHFPALVIDNFFDKPDEIAAIAQTLKYSPSANNNWPGVRSPELSKVEPKLWSCLFNKFFSLWYADEDLEKIQYRVNAYFQKIKPVSSNSDSVLNTGWVHVDGPSDSLGAGVIYLEPTADPSCGTGLYTDPYGFMDIDTGRYDALHIDDHKQKTFSGKFAPDEQKELEKVKTYYDSLFPPDIIVPNRYNRMIFYGHQYPHKHEYLGAKSDKERLTLVFFLYDIGGVNTPLMNLTRGL